MLWVGGIVLALANFVAVLNMTIANVTVPNIAGALGAGSSQGTWVITSYAVAEAITVPLDGMVVRALWRGQAVLHLVLLFGVFSLLCGMSTIPRHAARHARVAGHGRRAAAGALPDPAAAHLPQGAVHAGHGTLGDDDTARARGRAGARWMAVRQLLLAVGLLHQRAHGVALRRDRLGAAQALPGLRRS